MRIANGFFSTTVQGTLTDNNASLAKIMTQMSEGRRVITPSEDPIASVRLRTLDRGASMLDQYRSNIGTLNTRLQSNEITLKGMLDATVSAHDTLVWALNGANTSADLNAMATPLRSLLNSLVSAANTTDAAGNYLFSGTLSKTPAISYDATAALGSRYSFTGNSKTQQVEVGNGITQAANVSVDNVAGMLNRLESGLAVLSDPAADSNNSTMRAQLQATEGALNQAIDSLSSKISAQGSARSTMALLDDTYASMQVSNSEAASFADGIDMADLYDQLNQHTVAIQATYKVYGQIMKLNPFDELL
jgi:flagellar hook-associated protein 3 FlgL